MVLFSLLIHYTVLPMDKLGALMPVNLALKWRIKRRRNFYRPSDLALWSFGQKIVLSICTWRGNNYTEFEVCMTFWSLLKLLLGLERDGWDRRMDGQTAAFHNSRPREGGSYDHRLHDTDSRCRQCYCKKFFRFARGCL